MSKPTAKAKANQSIEQRVIALCDPSREFTMDGPTAAIVAVGEAVCARLDAIREEIASVAREIPSAGGLA